VRGIWVVFIALPLIAGLAYLLTHPGMLGYQGRPFTLDERLLTQPRVLWLYLRWLFIPDISAFGLFHDDIPVSTGFLSPPSTILAIIALVALLVAAIAYRRKAPFFSFAVLFFLANHLLESSIIPLEMVFEHRNYLASLGPLLFLAYVVTIASARMNVRPLAMVLGALLLASYTFVTYVRVDNWSSYESFIFSSAENHPDSPRSNFMAGQMLIAAIDASGGDAPVLAEAARGFLNKGLEADPRCINCLFGLLVLDLHQGIQPAPALITQLADTLRSGYVGPTKVSISQFSYLVRLQRSDGVKLNPKDLEAIFDAALTNPKFNHTGRAGIETAYREYYEFVAQDPDTALTHAEAAVRSWPDPWKYHMNLVQLLQQLGRSRDALAALEGAAAKANNETQQLETAKVRAQIERSLSN
jgi:hypothetical protein